MTLQTTIIRVATALACAGLWSAPAAAKADGPDHYRVIDVRGGNTLTIRSRPSRFGRSLGSIPFNARQIRHTSDYRHGWVRVVYGGRRGWVNNRYLAEDGGDNTGTYKVVGISDRDHLNLRRKPGRSARVIGRISYAATGIPSCGECKNGWCPVRADGRSGWVRQRYLKVERYSFVAEYPETNDDLGETASRRDRYNVRDRFDDQEQYQTRGSYQITNSEDETRSFRNRRKARQWRARFRRWFFGN